MVKAERWTIWIKSSQHIGWSKIRRRVFWAAGQIVVFEIRVFYSNTTRYANQNLQQCYASNENEKKRKYNNRVINVGQGCFTSLVFSVNGSMGCKCKKFYSVLAGMITIKRRQEYCIAISWLRRKISFSLMSSILLFCAIALSYPLFFCYWWLIMKKRGLTLTIALTLTLSGVQKCNSAVIYTW